MTMDRLLAGLLGFLLIASVGSHAAPAPEQYWKSALPNTPMPSSLSQRLNAPAGGTSLNVGSGGVHVHLDVGHGGNTVGVGKGGVGVNVNPGIGNGVIRMPVKPRSSLLGFSYNGAAEPQVHDDPSAAPKPRSSLLGFSYNGAAEPQVHDDPSAAPKPRSSLFAFSSYQGAAETQVHDDPSAAPKPRSSQLAFSYQGAAETQVHDDPVATLFFLEKDLHVEKKLDVHFMATPGAGEKFLPRSQADAIPFTSEKVPEILSLFSLEPDSVEAVEMTQTLRHCETMDTKGEKRSCATSLESMVDFATSSLGTSHVRVASTVVGKEGSPKQEYTMTEVKPAAGGADQLVACHAAPYAYAVFMCHLTKKTRAYTVSMVGRDGMMVEAVVVCHADTADWNPKHVAFQVLKVKPGVSMCHFLPQDHAVWTRSV